MKGSKRYRGDGSWQISVFVGRRPDGRQHRIWRTIHAPDNRTGERVVDRALAALVAEVDAGGHLPTQDVTVAQLLDRWLDHHGPSLEVRTLDAYRRDVTLHLAPSLGEVRLSKLRPADIDRLYDELRDQGLAAKTIRNVHGTFHTALGQAVRWGLLARNPAAAADPPTAKRRATVVPTAEQVTTVIAASSPSFAVLVRMAATTGHRMGSLLALRWTDLDLDAGEATFARAIAVVRGGLVEKGTKADRVDRATLGPVTLEALRGHRTRCAESALACGAGLRQDGFVWSQLPDGIRPWHPGGTSSRWRRTCRVADVTGVRFHDLKHFAATQMLAGGVPPHVVSQRTGTSAQTLQKIYAHHLPRADEDAADLMDRLLS
jgi:integrase